LVWLHDWSSYISSNFLEQLFWNLPSEQFLSCSQLASASHGVAFRETQGALYQQKHPRRTLLLTARHQGWRSLSSLWCSLGSAFSDHRHCFVPSSRFRCSHYFGSGFFD
jgi:hypothetical protein